MTEEANNEDLIAATIRRVAASKAARLPAAELADAPRAMELHLVPSGSEVGETDEPAPAERPAVDEDRIAATLRRIEEEQAARADAEASESRPESEDEPDSPEFTRAELAEPVPGPAHESRQPVDESVIEATLRRVEAQQAARADVASVDASGEFVEAPTGHELDTAASIEHERQAVSEPRGSVDESAIEATLRRIEAQQAERATAPATAEHQRAGVEALLEDASWEQVARELRRELDETRSELRWLASRVDALMSGAGDDASSTVQAAPQRLVTKPQPRATADDEWDDSPQLPRIPLGVPPRPAIIRDPSPQTATAAQLEYDDDANPAPRTDETPAVSAAAAAKRGFELLPRTYRITVEDKRRGVDLVPLHRALLGLEGVRDISLLSYSNGTAIVAAESTGELLPDVLGAAVSHAMAREVKVEVHNEQTMVIKLAED